MFVVSWVNPDERLADKTFEDYMTEGMLARHRCGASARPGVEKINVIGYCVGGTLLGTTLAYLAARGEEPFTSATFFAAQVDFTKAGDLLLFIDDAQLKALEEMMAERGYLDGSRMATVFNMLRPKDLIWPYIVNNYMLGKKPFPFDLLFWNQDSTRMPAANHNFYLREFYHENKLARGQMTIGGVKLDLGKVKLPIYELCAKEDHIAPAKSVFIGSRLFGGPVDLRAGGLGPHRRRHQSARRQGEVPVLDQRQEDGDAGGLARGREGASGLLVAALRRVAGEALGRQGAGPRRPARSSASSRTRRAATSR